MKLIHIIALALAFSASYPVYAQANKSGVKTFASRQEDPSPIEITAYENRIKVENAPVGSILEIYSVVGIKGNRSQAVHRRICRRYRKGILYHPHWRYGTQGGDTINKSPIG